MWFRRESRMAQDYNETLELYSSAIKVCRVLCIFFMAYVHVHLFESEVYQGTSYYLGARAILADFLGRSSVPLLSIVSGFLMVGYFRRKPYVDVLLKRAVVLLVPLVFWNLVGVSIAFVRGKEDSSFLLNQVLPVWESGFYVHLDFLRDLFVISLLTPLLVWILARFGVWGILLIIFFTFVADLSPFIFRDQILIFYSFGVFVALYKFYPNRLSEISKVAFYILFLILAFLAISGVDLPFERAGGSIGDFVVRVIVSYVFWSVSVYLVKTKVIGAVTRIIEPNIYFMFLSHIFFIHLLGSMYFRADALHGPISYFMTWLLVPLFCLLCAISCGYFLKRMPAWLCLVVAGKER